MNALGLELIIHWQMDDKWKSAMCDKTQQRIYSIVRNLTKTEGNLSQVSISGQSHSKNCDRQTLKLTMEPSRRENMAKWDLDFMNHKQKTIVANILKYCDVQQNTKPIIRPTKRI